MLPKLTFNPGVGPSIFVILIISMHQQSITTGDMSTDHLEADFTGAITKTPTGGLRITLELFDRASFMTTNETIQIEMQSHRCYDWEKVRINLNYLNFLGGSQYGPSRYEYDLTLLPHKLFIQKMGGGNLPQPIYDGTLPIACYDGGIQMTFYGVSNLRLKLRPTTTTTTTTMRPPPARKPPKSNRRPNRRRPKTTTNPKIYTHTTEDPLYNVKTTELTPTSSESPSVTGLNMYYIALYSLLATFSMFILVFGVYLTHKKFRKRDSDEGNGGVNTLALDNATIENRHRHRQYPMSNRHRHRQYPMSNRHQHRIRHPTDQNQYIPREVRPPAPSAPLIERDSPPDYKDVQEDFPLPPPSYEEAVHRHHVSGR